jgi:hypothetical protein
MKPIMILIFFALCIPILYWALAQPERAFVPGWRRRILWIIALAIVALVLFAATTEQPGFSLLFVAFPILYGVLLHRQVRALFRRWIGSRIGRFVLVFALLWFSELFAALDIADRDPVGRHMIVYLGFYVGLALVITFVVPRWQYGFAALYTVGGLWGITVERQFAGIQMLVAGDLISFIAFASLIFSVYGLYAAGPYLLLHEEWSGHRPAPHWRHIVLFVLLAVVPLVTWGIFNLILARLGFDVNVLVV